VVDKRIMKIRYHQSSTQLLSQAPAHSNVRVVLPLIVVLMLFFLLPGLLAAQEAAESVQSATESSAGQAATPQLREQAVAAAVAAVQRGSTDEAPVAQALSRELRTERLWLLPRQSAFTELIRRAGRQALQHPDCNEVLYGSLNEFRTERTGTSFTILCMKDARTTFNQVFFADDLMTEEDLNVAEQPSLATEELERLRQMMQPQSVPGSTQQAEPVQPAVAPENQAVPVVF
jgi:hypothetical protein